ncbi:low temperature requirement protein A [Actinocorallia sp. A-T 12471]|uniref:low temperature requirement protein A n=1 Tax=Actinocorallia sp. A-T 12471 TaxID=3089813 RepID=UPI0029CC0A6A|nr:low temperature requirement protein A [Actinocorallia sp. A-T 12471]MDX6744395.1 low temperature requirement protein A [Actinocorallia sp. A-T 12471]
MANLHRTMQARDPAEEHRASTPLELFFDLCFVVAVAQAGSALHHAVDEGRVMHGLGAYLMVFFAIWWAWMNFTWFASAYDTDDVPYRCAVLVQIVGSLIIAAGVGRAFTAEDFTVVVIGYGVMRAALVCQWLRVAVEDPSGRATAVRSAVGLVALQCLWVGFLFVPPELRGPAWAACALLDLAVPVLAAQAQTSWHPGHIAERYGLFTLIVLGESVGAAALAFQDAFALGHTAQLVVTALGGVLVMTALWWLYFSRDAAVLLTSARAALVWGYGHYMVFASSAAVGAGLSIVASREEGQTEIPEALASASVTVPVAVFLTALWFLHRRSGGTAAPVAITTALVLASTFTPAAVPLTGLALVALVTLRELQHANTPPTPA